MKENRKIRMEDHRKKYLKKSYGRGGVWTGTYDIVADSEDIETCVTVSPNPAFAIFKLLKVGPHWIAVRQSNTIRSGMTTTPPPMNFKISEEQARKILEAESDRQLRMLRRVTEF